jgi:hypothetical protein
MTWHAIVNDLVGGWAVADDPNDMSQHSPPYRRPTVIADMCSYDAATLIARLLNEYESRA